MRPPGFWQRPPDAPGLLARVLQPFGHLYAAATARRVAATGYRASIPVICVGNLNIGGTGKTPTVIAIVQHLATQGMAAQIVTRGYGGNLAGPVRVDETRHSASQVGDEPLLLAAFTPVWVARDRAVGVRRAEAAGAQVVVLDDGHQNPSVIKDLSVVVADAGYGFGNGLCLPAGPLREPVANGMSRADLLVTIGSDTAQTAFDVRWGHLVACPHQRAELEPLAMGMDWAGTRVFAFAGIGHPDKFFATLRGLGADIVGSVALSDHQPLGDALLQRLESDAQRLGAQLVTTEKDAVRLPETYRSRVLTLPVRLTLAPPLVLQAALDSFVSPQR